MRRIRFWIAKEQTQASKLAMTLVDLPFCNVNDGVEKKTEPHATVFNDEKVLRGVCR